MLKKRHSQTKLQDLRQSRINCQINLNTYKESFQSKPPYHKPLQTEEPETKPFGTMPTHFADHSRLNINPQPKEEELN